MGMGLGYSAIYDKILRTNRWTFFVTNNMPERDVTIVNTSMPGNNAWGDTIICKVVFPKVTFKTNNIVHVRETISYPTRIEYSELQIEMYKLSRDTKLYVWFTKMWNNDGMPSFDYYTDTGILNMLDGEGRIQQRWAFYNCYPIEFEFGDDFDYASPKFSKSKAKLKFSRFERLL